MAPELTREVRILNLVFSFFVRKMVTPATSEGRQSAVSG